MQKGNHMLEPEDQTTLIITTSATAEVVLPDPEKESI